MTRHTWARPAAALAALTLGASLTPTIANAAPARETAATTTTATTTTATTTTALTFEAPACNGCRLTLVQANEDAVWSSKAKTVRNGEVTFAVDQSRTHGMSVAITTPWEGGTGYVTHVGFKYSGKQSGDHVSFSDARHARKASACWAGTTADTATIRLATRRVTVPGYDGEDTPAALVYTTTTQDAMVPMLQTFNGIVGSQDVNFCGPH